MKNLLILLTILFSLIILLNSCNQKEHVMTTKDLKNENVTNEEIYEEIVTRNQISEKGIRNDTLKLNENLANYSVDTLYRYLKGIYGKDNRKNIYEINTNKALMNNVNTVVCMVLKSQLQNNNNGTFTLKNTGIYSDVYGLCSEERFASEPTSAICSGFAISGKFIATAGHCLNSSNFKDYYFVFGFQMKDKDNWESNIPVSDIFEPIKIIDRVENKIVDYAIVEVKNISNDSEIPLFRIAKLRTSGKIADKQTLHVIGHPCGLPLKITPEGMVFSNTNSNYFVTNLDTYGGNSGSPVFNSETYEVEGILVRGDKDFEFIRTSACYQSKLCPQTIGKCFGEDVVRVSVFINLLPK